MPLKEKRRRTRDRRRSGYAAFETGSTATFRKRRRITVFVFLLLAALIVGSLGTYLFSNTSEEASNEPAEQPSTPTVGQPSRDTATEKKASQEEEASQVVPDDPTLYLTVPRLGIYDHTVRNDRSEQALDLGAIKLPVTDFPWQEGPTNTYIACHRLGWPGLESFHQCLNLPSMQKGDEIYLKDTLGRVYEYRVSEFLQVMPEEAWVTNRDSDREMISLQTCIETFGDFATLGPNWAVRFIVRADRVA
jgi:sortase A